MLILAIDTSTNILSVALVRGDEVLASIDEPTKNNQSEKLMPRIENLMKVCQLKPTDLGKIAVAIGPGSYTGIRVGVAAAKSLAYALDIPLVGVSSLEVMAAVEGDACLIIPMIDARRGTVFSGCYEAGHLVIPDGHYTIEALIGELKKNWIKVDRITFIGDGAVAYKENLMSLLEYADVKSELELKGCKAVALAKLAQKRLAQKNIHEFVPNYLRKTEAEMNLNG